MPFHHTCQQCGQEFSRPNRRPARFCSRSCTAKSRTGERSSKWHGGPVSRTCALCGKPFTVISAAKAQRFCSRSCAFTWKTPRQEKPYAKTTVAGKQRLAHRVLMEAHLGRSLGRDEIIHHINGDATDNRIENLEVMSQAAHLQLHAKQGRRFIRDLDSQSG
jgi:hypothetical protein